MKKHKLNKGFTLVECIVALALFAIMAAVVFGILGNSTIIQKNNNAINNNLKAQQEEIADGQYSLVADAQNVTIPFSNNESINVSSVSLKSPTFNSDGTASENQLGLNVLTAPITPPTTTIDPSDPAYILATAVVYGSSKLTSIHIEEKEKTEGTTATGMPYYHIKLYLKITDNSFVLSSKQIASKNRNFLKLRLPVNAYNLKISNNVYLAYSTMDSNEFDTDGKIAQKSTTIRFIRSNNNNVVNPDAYIEFDISKTDYENHYVNFKTYFNVTDLACNFKEYKGLGIYRNDVT